MEQDYESSSEGDCWDDDREETLKDIETAKTIKLSIRANYTNWKPREAFRELVQNWRDGIIRAFHLREEQFIVVREEKTSGQSTEIVYKVPRFGSEDKKEWLGYIRFLGRGGEGTVEAGAHGEGLKIALLVLMRGRQNHAVRCRSGGFNWKFNFTTSGHLVARLRRMTPEAIRRAEDQAARQVARALLPFAADPRDVVQFVVGERRKGRNERGQLVKRDAVSRDEFDEWTRAALFLHDTPEGGIVSTEHGDLLSHPDLCGSIYLKGLLLAESAPGRSASITRLPLKFGYNFASGNTNRERQSVASADEESRAMLAIWDRAVRVKPAMARDLSGMLNSAEVDYADVYGAKRRMCLETASALKRYLRNEEGPGNWYYCAEDESMNPRLDHIIQGLGREPYKLTKTYWDIMRRHKLLRTAEEEESLLFNAAPPAAVPETAFSASVHRLFRACARASPQMAGIGIGFVAAERLHLQLFYSEADGLFRIHERWLTPQGAASELGLREGLAEGDLVSHAVKRLFAEALEQLPQRVFLEGEDGTRTAESRRKGEVSRAEQRMMEYLRLEDFTAHRDPDTAPQLVLRRSYIPHGHENVEIEVQCHQSRCPNLKDALIANDVRSEVMPCISPDEHGSQTTCHARRYGQWEDDHHQTGLEEDREYFFVITTPSDPSSIVKISNAVTTASRPPPAPSPSPDHPPQALEDRDESMAFESPRSSPATPMFSPSRHGVEVGTGSARGTGDGLNDEAMPDRTTTSGVQPPTPAPFTARDGDPPGIFEAPQDAGVEQMTFNGDQSSTRPPATDGRPAGTFQAPTKEEGERKSTNGVQPPTPAPDTPGRPAATSEAPAIAGVERTATSGARPPTQAPVANGRPTGTPKAPAETATPPGLFVPGSPLRNLDIFDIERDGWYEAKTSDNVRAVLGILRGQQYPPSGGSRKRRRTSNS